MSEPKETAHLEHEHTKAVNVAFRSHETSRIVLEAIDLGCHYFGCHPTRRFASADGPIRRLGKIVDSDITKRWFSGFGYEDVSLSIGQLVSN